MKYDGSIIAPIVMLGVVLAAGAYAALNTLNVDTALTVKEPLRIKDVQATGALILDSNLICTPTRTGNAVPVDGYALTILGLDCSASLFAGEGGSVIVTVGNAASVPISVQPSGSSSSADVTMVVPTQGTVPATGLYQFEFAISVSASAVPDVTVSLTMGFER